MPAGWNNTEQKVFLSTEQLEKAYANALMKGNAISKNGWALAENMIWNAWYKSVVPLYPVFTIWPNMLKRKKPMLFFVCRIFFSNQRVKKIWLIIWRKWPNIAQAARSSIIIFPLSPKSIVRRPIHFLQHNSNWISNFSESHYCCFFSVSMPRLCDLAEKHVPTFNGIKFTSSDLNEGISCLKPARKIFLGSNTIILGALVQGFDSTITTTSNMYPGNSLPLKVTHVMRNALD